MTENSSQPKPDDAVLGGQNSAPLNALVLGGIAGVKHRLDSDNIQLKFGALQEALKYGQNGLELLIQALRNDIWSVQCRAYDLLQENAELGLKQALSAYNPYFLKCLYTISGPSDSVHSVAFSPDGRTLASGSSDKTIKLWYVKTGEPKSILTRHDSFSSVVFSPDGRTLASGSWDKTIKLWDVETGELKITLTGHSDGVVSVAFSPDGRIASGSEDETIKLWGQENSTQFKQEPVEFFHRYLALKEASESGDSGLYLLMSSLKDQSLPVRQTAYSLIQKSKEPKIKQLLQEYLTRQGFGSTKPYAQLKFFFFLEMWQEAEKETENILFKISGCERGADPESLLNIRRDYVEYFPRYGNLEGISSSIPDNVLQDILNLWQSYSSNSSSFDQQKPSLVFWLELRQKIESFLQTKKDIPRNTKEFHERLQEDVREMYGGDR